MTNVDPEEEIHEVFLVSPITGEPFPDQEPFILTKEDYELVTSLAENNGVTFDEAFAFLLLVDLD